MSRIIKKLTPDRWERARRQNDADNLTVIKDADKSTVTEDADKSTITEDTGKSTVTEDADGSAIIDLDAANNEEPPSYVEACPNLMPVRSLWLCPHSTLSESALYNLMDESCPQVQEHCRNCVPTCQRDMFRQSFDRAIFAAASERRFSTTGNTSKRILGASLASTRSPRSSLELIRATVLFSSPSHEEMSTCLKEYFAHDRVQQTLRNLNIPLCQHLNYNSQYVVNTFKPTFHDRIHWGTGPLALTGTWTDTAHCLCNLCPGPTQRGTSQAFSMDSRYTKCWNPRCGFSFRWSLRLCDSSKTRARIISLEFCSRWTLKGNESIACTIPSFTPDQSREWGEIWGSWDRAASGSEREWMSQTPRRENCKLDAAHSCLRSPLNLDLGFEEPRHRH